MKCRERGKTKQARMYWVLFPLYAIGWGSLEHFAYCGEVADLIEFRVLANEESSGREFFKV